MNRRSLILSALAPLAIAVGVSACTVPPPVKPLLIRPAYAFSPSADGHCWHELDTPTTIGTYGDGTHPCQAMCDEHVGARVTAIEGYALGCDVVGGRGAQVLDERMMPTTGAYGATWQARCLNYGGTVDTTSGAAFMCRDIDY